MLCKCAILMKTPLFFFQMDYPALDVSQTYKPPVKVQSNRRAGTLPKFDDTTSNKLFFQQWHVTPRVRYTDFHEGHSYVPPREKFDAKSTTHDTYVGRSAPVPHSYKPEEKPIDQKGTFDFKTMNKMEFQPPKMSERLTREQKKQILKELRRRKAAEARFDTANFYMPVGAN